MSSRSTLLLTLIHGCLLAAVSWKDPAAAQQVGLTTNGFTIGTSSGRSSFYRQESKSEANALLQVIRSNVSNDPGTTNYRITNPLEAFSAVNERHSQSAGESTISIGGASFSGFNYSVFAQ